MTDTFLDALVFAVCTVVLCLGSREFGLFNLAAGGWIVLGGWLATSIRGWLTDTFVPVHPWPFMLFGGLAGLQCLCPFLLGEALRLRPLVYLFFTVGITLCINTFGPAFLLKNYGSVIASDLGLWGTICTLIGAFAAFCVPMLTFRSSLWARLVIDFRIGAAPPSHIAGLLFLEIVLLVLIGATAGQVHKGIFASTEQRTVVPILGLLSMQCRPVASAMVSFLAVLAGHFSAAKVSALAGHSVPVTIGLLLLLALVRNWPQSSLLGARSIAPVPPPTAIRTLSRGSIPLGAVVFLTLVGIAVLTLGASSELFQRALFLSVLVVISCTAQRHLGIRSVAWPAIATLATYTVLEVRDNAFFLFIALIASSIAWSFYLWSLRVLRPEAALVVDLALIVCLHHWLTHSRLPGPENVRIFHLSAFAAAPAMVLATCQVLVGLSLLALLLSAGMGHELRALSLGLCNFRLAIHHGIAVRLVFCAVAFTLVILAAWSGVILHVAYPIVSPAQMTLLIGLTVMLFGDLMTAVGPAVSFAGIFAIYILLERVAVRYGDLLGGGIGIAFLAVAITSGAMRHEARNSPAA